MPDRELLPGSAPARARSRHRRGEPRPFDFRRPTTLAREHVRTLHIVQETFARGLATVLSSQLRAVTHVNGRAVEQRTYDEYVRDVASPTYMAVLALPPLTGAAILQLPLDVAYCAIELLLGGKGDRDQPDRAFTDLEMVLARGIVEHVLPELRYAFEPVVVTEPAVISQASNPQFPQICVPTDMTIVLSFDVRIESSSGVATLCIPHASLQPPLDALSATAPYTATASADAAVTRQRLSEHLAATPVEVAARFQPIEMSAADIVRLQVGDVVPLGHPTDEPLTLSVDGVPTFEARIGRRNRRLAVRIEGPAEPADSARVPRRVHLGESGPAPT